MTPNVSRLLIKWGVADLIGEDLVQCQYINMRNTAGEVVQRTELYPKVVREFGFPVSCAVSRWLRLTQAGELSDCAASTRLHQTMRILTCECRGC